MPATYDISLIHQIYPEHEQSNADAFTSSFSETAQASIHGQEIIHKHRLGGAFLHHSNSIHFITMYRRVLTVYGQLTYIL